MRIPRILTLFLGALLFAACSKDAPPPATPAEANAPRPVAEQEREIAARLAEQKSALDAQSALQSRKQDRERQVMPFLALMDRFDEVRGLMSRSERKETNEELNSTLEKIRSDANQLPADGCVISARNTLYSALDKTKALFDLSKDPKTANTPAVQQKVNDAFAEQQKARAEFDACLIVN
ncbi:MAG: hypothetical protein JNM76_10415 [Betaproteobacteria bacterium]|nr:hypothetical protein [Betaproteobacteria bacterium]